MKYPLALLAALALTVPVAAPASAAAPLGVSLKRLTATEATIRTTCPKDPPDNAIITADNQFLGIVPFTCTRHPQRVRIPLQVTLTPGQTLHHVVVTVSGDGGEINAFYDSVVVAR